MRTIWPIPKIEFIPFSQIGEIRPTALFTSAPAWNAVGAALHLPVTCQFEITQANEAVWQTLIGQIHAEVIYAVGGGLTADAAKYCAAKLDLPLICLPTALSVDAFLTSASGVRQEGCVRYFETKVPERLIVDLAVIAGAPASIRAAGICDVLSIATGCWDWQLAHQKGMNPPGMEYLPYAAKTAQGILQGALDCAEAAGRGDSQGLTQLLDCLALEVQLTNQLGHARPEEGSEHYFCYAVENYTGHGLPHADLLAPGILLMARAQGQETSGLERALRNAQVRLDAIHEDAIENTLRQLPAYCRRHELPYGIAHEIGD